MEAKKILIIDDDKDLTASLLAILTDEGYKVDIANEAETGLEKFKAEKPDLLILDVMMDHNLEGHGIAHTIKGDQENVNVPILVITGMRDALGVNIRDAFEMVEGLPYVFLLDKPFETDELLKMVKNLIAGTLEE